MDSFHLRSPYVAGYEQMFPCVHERLGHVAFPLRVSWTTPGVDHVTGLDTGVGIPILVEERFSLFSTAFDRFPIS